MKTIVRCLRSLGALAFALSTTSPAEITQLVSVPDNASIAADAGSGDSVTPIISADGRYVLFASTANNLVVIGTNQPIPAISPAPMNVYLRDRVSSTTTLISVNLAGTGGGNDNSWPISISTNGQFVLFESAASNLVPNDTNNATDVFVRNLVTTQTVLVSAKSNGAPGNRDSSGSAMTSDGHYVAFLSSATDLVANDLNGIADVFVRDLQTGGMTLVSVGAKSVSGAVQPSLISPEISDDGRYVLFTSPGTNLVAGVQTTNELYLRDLVGGTTVWASSAATQAVWNVFHNSRSVSFNYIMSRDGRYVAYETYAPSANLTTGLILRYDNQTALTDVISTNALVVPLGNIHSLDMTPDGRFVAFIGSTNGPPANNSSIFVWDSFSGNATLASGDVGGQIPSNSICAWPVLDSAGQYVAFLSAGSGLVTNPVSSDFHLYRRDLLAGNTVLLDSNTNNSGALLNTAPISSISPDGQLVAFESSDAQLVGRDSNRSLDVFVRNIGSNSTELISARATALPSPTVDAPNTLSPFSVSSDGRFIAFSTEADNVIANDANNCPDVVVRDLLLGTNLLVSANTNNLPANNFSTTPVISGDGRYVAFASTANDLVPGDANKSLDVFMRDTQTGLTTLISVNTIGIPGNKDSSLPLVSANARFVLFHSAATDLAPGSYTGGDNLFLRDRQSGSTVALTMGSASSIATMTPDGHYIAFVGGLSPSSVTATLYVWDTQSFARIYTNTTSGIVGLAITPDGHKLIYAVSGQGLSSIDPISNSGGLFLSAYKPAAKPGLRISADGRFLVGSLWNPNFPATNQVHLIDLQTSLDVLVSHKYNNPSTPGNGNSDSPDISADGRLVSYRSTSIDILPSDTVSVPDIFLYDNVTGLTTLLTTSRFGNRGADNRSRSPIFSGDGKILFFESSASDLVGQTFNFNPNIFAYGTYVMPPFPVAVMLDTQGPLLSWPTVPGKTYQVQFKNSVNDPLWQDLSGDVSTVGNVEYFRDTSPSPVLRFYRIKSF
jgi:hypothetical protein